MKVFSEMVEQLGRVKVHDLIKVMIDTNQLMANHLRPINWRQPLEYAQLKADSRCRSTGGNYPRTIGGRSNLSPNHRLYLGIRRRLAVSAQQGIVTPCGIISNSLSNVGAIVTHNEVRKR